jgi:N-acetylneuraminate synthase
LGRVDYGRKSSEQGNVKFRRSLYFVKDMMAGDVITADCVRSVRPGSGLPPKLVELVVGAVVKCNVSFGTPVKNDLLI